MILIKENFEDGKMNYFGIKDSGIDDIVNDPANSMDDWSLHIPPMDNAMPNVLMRRHLVELKKGHTYTFNLFAKGDPAVIIRLSFVNNPSGGHGNPKILAQAEKDYLSTNYSDVPYTLKFTALENYPYGGVHFQIGGANASRPSFVDNIEVSVES